MKHTVHAIAGSIALLTILSFWSLTIGSELFGSPAQIAGVKTTVLYGMLVLIPAMIAAGASGASLGKGWRLPVVAQKSNRMRIIAANGILILLPTALFLASKAQAAEFDSLFYTAQAAELIAGGINITLLSLNMRDGMQLRGRRKDSRKGSK